MEGSDAGSNEATVPFLPLSRKRKMHRQQTRSLDREETRGNKQKKRVESGGDKGLGGELWELSGRKL